MKKLIIFGIGDIAEVAKYFFDHDSDYSVCAFVLDKDYIQSDEFCGLPLVCFDEVAEKYPPTEYDAFVSIGYSKMNKIRQLKYEAMKALGYSMASYISSKATVLIDRDKIGDNCFLLEDNTIQPFVTIGNNVTLWSGNHIGHHVSIGDHVFISSHVVLSGRASVGDNSFVGVNATVNDHIKIADHCIIGSGALITRDTGAGEVYKSQRTQASELQTADVRFMQSNAKS